MGVGIRVSSNQWCSSHFTKDCVDKKCTYSTANCWKDTKKLFCIKRNFRKSLKRCFGEMPVHLFLQFIAHFPNLSTQLVAEWKFSKWHFDPPSHHLQPAGDKEMHHLKRVRNPKSAFLWFWASRCEICGWVGWKIAPAWIHLLSASIPIPTFFWCSTLFNPINSLKVFLNPDEKFSTTESEESGNTTHLISPTIFTLEWPSSRGSGLLF